MNDKPAFPLSLENSKVCSNVPVGAYFEVEDSYLLGANTIMKSINEVRTFWNTNPCGSRDSLQQNKIKYFNEIAYKRYLKEWHIPIVANFSNFKNFDVLEIGCGLGTDGLQFRRNNARYVGVDLTPTAIEMTKEHFRLFGFQGKFLVVNAEKLPFTDNTFDHIYSFGVIHHSPNTEAIVQEMHRVLRPGGSFCVMVYNKTSINYYIEIMFLRKMFRLLLYPSCMPMFISKITGLDKGKLHDHRNIMLSKKMSKQEWININTDGPGCPLAKIYNKNEALCLFKKFEDVKTEVWFFDKSHWPFIGRLLPRYVCRLLGRYWGWHRIIYGRKPVCTL